MLRANDTLLQGCATAVDGIAWPPGVVRASMGRLVVDRSGNVEIEAAGVAIGVLGNT